MLVPRIQIKRLWQKPIAFRGPYKGVDESTGQLTARPIVQIPKIEKPRMGDSQSRGQ